MQSPGQQLELPKGVKRDHEGQVRTNSFVGELVDYEDTLQRYNSTLQLAWSETLDESGLPGSNKYKSVHVLMLSWEPRFDDLKVQGEIADLRRVFEEDFKYHVTVECLNRVEKKRTQNQINKIVANWVWEHDASNALLIVYFAGHGRPGSKPGDLELAGQKSPSDVRDYLDRVVWNYTEHALLELQSDVFQIFDCCYAGTIETRGANPNASEFLAATDAAGTTPKPGDSSFTRALIWALKELVEVKRRFTTTDLVSKIREAPNFPSNQRPVLSKRSDNLNGQLIILQPPADSDSPPPSANTLSGAALSDEPRQDVLTLKFVFETRPDTEHIRNLASGLYNIIHRDQLRISRVMFAGVQPKQHDMFFKAVKRFRDAAGRKKSKGDVASSAKALVADMEEEMEKHILEKFKKRRHEDEDEAGPSDTYEDITETFVTAGMPH